MKTVISTPEAPAAIGPYSQAIRAGELLFVSGQIALHPETGQLVGETPSQQVHQLMTSMGRVLAAAGAGFEDVVKTTIFLADMNDFGEVNEAYASYFPSDPPARATVEVSRLPKDVLVEVDAIAQVPV